MRPFRRLAQLRRPSDDGLRVPADDLYVENVPYDKRDPARRTGVAVLRSPHEGPPPWHEETPAPTTAPTPEQYAAYDIAAEAAVRDVVRSDSYVVLPGPSGSVNLFTEDRSVWNPYEPGDQWSPHAAWDTFAAHARDLGTSVALEHARRPGGSRLRETPLGVSPVHYGLLLDSAERDHAHERVQLLARWDVAFLAGEQAALASPSPLAPSANPFPGDGSRSTLDPWSPAAAWTLGASTEHDGHCWRPDGSLVRSTPAVALLEADADAQYRTAVLRASARPRLDTAGVPSASISRREVSGDGPDLSL